MGEVTEILEAMSGGEVTAAERLLELVYAELRSIAVYRMAQESPGHTLQPTALVHEAWMRIQGHATNPGRVGPAKAGAEAGLCR
jgi:DNA-directed RNA polymerase specialized sigma24 family protein